jgi:PAS domain-containing protein
MLAGTPSGDAYTFAELQHQLEEAGFRDVSAHRCRTPQTVLLARTLRSPGAYQTSPFNRDDDGRILAAIIESSDGRASSPRTSTGIILSWNRGAERMYGYSASEAIGRPISILIPG